MLEDPQTRPGSCRSGYQFQLLELERLVNWSRPMCSSRPLTAEGTKAAHPTHMPARRARVTNASGPRARLVSRFAFLPKSSANALARARHPTAPPRTGQAQPNHAARGDTWSQLGLASPPPRERGGSRRLTGTNAGVFYHSGQLGCVLIAGKQNENDRFCAVQPGEGCVRLHQKPIPQYHFYVRR
jgi:hypothetical protein